MTGNYFFQKFTEEISAPFSRGLLNFVMVNLLRQLLNVTHYVTTLEEAKYR